MRGGASKRKGARFPRAATQKLARCKRRGAPHFARVPQGLGLALAIAAFAFAQAGAKPNFSGTWKLNAAKSDFGAMPAPVSRIDKITHFASALTDSFTQNGPRGEVSAELKYSIDGQETTNVIGESKFKSTAKWEGDALMIDTKADFNGAVASLKERWSLSADGKTLTIQRHSNTPLGETDQKIVLEKQ